MGRPFGSYVMEEKIGTGGMGEVYRATRLGADGFQVQVAVKVILDHLAGDGAFSKKLWEEAQITAFLQHPNIVQVINYHIVEGRPVIEMEYLPGTDLRKILRRLSGTETLSLDESVHILHSAARGLDAAHGLRNERVRGGIIHCDLNPHNILISVHGEVKVTDFGIARALQGDSAASATVRGKLAYMSPEQLEGRKLDRRTDLFSLGIIAYQLLAGVHPFDRGSEGGTVAAIGKADFTPLQKTAPDLPEPLYEAVHTLLEPDPSDRPDSAAEVAGVLEPLLRPSAANALAARVRALTTERTSDGPGSGRVSRTLSPTALTIRAARLPRRMLLLAAGGALLAAAAGILWMSAGTVNSRRTAPVEAPPARDAGQPEFLPEPAAPAVKRKITLVTVPAGAEILADGTSLGTSPVTLETSAGDSWPALVARLYGHRTSSFRIPSAAGERMVVTLAPLPTGTVRIGARPWARVSFRGQELGYTPLDVPDVPVGRRTFSLSYEPEGMKRDVTVDVAEGMNEVSVEMVKMR